MKVLTFAAFLAMAIPAVTAAEDTDPVEVYEEEEEYDDEEYEEEEYSVMYAPSPDVTTSFYFPDYPNQQIPLGEEVTVLIGLSNSGDKVLNVSYVGAQLHSPYDLNYYIQNFTVKEIWATVLPQSEVTVEYKFKADANLEPLEFWLSGFVFYNSTDDMYAYRSTWTNQTITLTPAGTSYDVQTLFTYVLILAIVGLIVYVIAGLTGTKKTLQKQIVGVASRATKAAAPAPKAKTDADDDWGVPVYKPAAKAKAVSSGKSRRGKSPKKQD